jgi:hypothetical protein
MSLEKVLGEIFVRWYERGVVVGWGGGRWNKLQNGEIPKVVALQMLFL